jgi:hypothetical protein
MATSILAAAYDAILSLVTPVATDPKRCKPGQLCQILNSTPLGHVLKDRALRAHREAAGNRIGDEKSIDLLRYTAWLANQVRDRKLPAAGDVADAKDVYAAKKEKERARNAAASRSGRDVGPLPPVADPKRRAAAEKSLLVFCETYFPGRFYLGWSKDHLKVIERLQKAVEKGGLFALAMPRGSGKTNLCEVAVLWATMTGRRFFVVLIGASRGAAMENAHAIRAELELNDLLAADFPEVCVPIRKLEGFANRCTGQLCDGERTHIRWGADEIVLPSIKGSKASGAIIRLAGITARLRGMNFTRPDGQCVRPDFVIPDDPQTDKSAISEPQCDQRERIMQGAVLGLAGPGKKIAGVAPMTVVRTGDLADRLLDRDRFPEWQGERFKLLYQFPDNMKEWEHYRELFVDSLRNDGDGKEAREHYKKKRKVMDAGAVVAWKDRKESDDISAIEYAMRLFFKDEAAFYAEYQNEPIVDTIDQNALSPEKLALRLNNLGRGVVPNDCTHVTAFIDVQKKCLYWLVAAWSEDFGGAVLDFGTWPDQERRYFTLRQVSRTLQKAFPKASLEGQLYDGLTATAAYLFGREWKRENGTPMPIEKLLVDANWGESTDVVYRWCRETTHKALVFPSHGKYISASAKQFHEYKRAPGEVIGTHWLVPSVAGKRAIRHVLIDTNYWKSFLAARFTTAVGERSSLMFSARAKHGKQPADDLSLLFDHLASEFPTRVASKGREIDEWKVRPNADNHLLDCAVGCAVGASMVGVKLLASQTVRKPKPTVKKERVSYLF